MSGGDDTRLRPSASDDPPPAGAVAGLTLVREVCPPESTVARGEPGGALAAAAAGLTAARTEFGEGYCVRGRYLLQELIGRGAMGHVWRAKDLLAEEAQDRDPHVAVKVLNADFAARPDAFVALHREAARAQKLAHPNVVTVHVFDRDEASGRVFIAMELLEGRPLDEVIRTAGPNGVPRQRALPIIRGMAEGLAYAHRKGIVHSDFKPANVFLTPDGTPKILDFGIARAVQVAGAPAGAEADDSGFQGLTPSYAAPEALAGSAPSTAEDVFSLGVVSFELITGRHPFNRRSAIEARDAREPRRPLRGLKLREARAIDRALSFERAARFPDAGTFLRALRGVPVIQKALVATVAILVLAAGALWYRNYLDSLPQPWEQLPTKTREDFIADIKAGQEALDFIARTHDVTVSTDAVKYFDTAYRLHPRDPEAVRGLEAAARYAIDWYAKAPDKREALQQLQLFQAKSDYYKTYAPMQRAIRAVGGD
jgi:serine/threonine protein kinase